MAKKAAPRQKRFSDETLAEAARKRAERRVIARYLETLEARSRNGHRKDPATIQAKIDLVDLGLAEAGPVRRLLLTQERLDLAAELESLEAQPEDDFEIVEGEFVEVAADWAARESVTYQAFRAMGVPAATLRSAGITRSSH